MSKVSSVNKIEKKKVSKTKFVQARVPVGLYKLVDAKLKREKLMWSELIRASCRAYLDN